VVVPIGRRLRSLLSQAITYSMSGIVARAVGVFLVPVYLHAAGTRAYGVVELMIASVIFASILLRLGISATMARFTLGEPGLADYAPVIHTVFVFVLAVSTAALLPGLLLRDQIAALLQVSPRIVVIGLFGLWVTMNYDVYARVYRVERRARQWVVFSLLNVAITVVLTLIFVLPLDMGATGLLLGNFTGTGIVYVILTVARRHTVGFRRFSRPLLRELLAYSIPLMPANIALWALNVADRVQVQRLASPTDLGTYSVAARVAVPMVVIVGAFQTAWAPFAQAVRGDEGDAAAKETYREVLTYWSYVMGWGLVGLTMLTPPYIRLAFPAATHGAIPVVSLLALGTVLYGGYLIVSIGVTISRRTRMSPVIASLAAALNLGLNFWAIPRYGIVGAGATTVIGYGVVLWLQWLNAQSSYPVPYDWNRVARVAAVTAGFFALSFWVIPEVGAVGIILRLIAAASFPLGLVIVGAVRMSDVRRGRALLSSGRGRPAEART
jgi:O-antigen/teichoic acid export membrane protein